jgi:hypothetical protein
VYRRIGCQRGNDMFYTGQCQNHSVNDRLARLIKREGNRDFMTTLLVFSWCLDFPSQQRAVGGEMKNRVWLGERGTCSPGRRQRGGSQVRACVFRKVSRFYTVTPAVLDVVPSFLTCGNSAVSSST